LAVVIYSTMAQKGGAGNPARRPPPPALGRRDGGPVADFSSL